MYIYNGLFYIQHVQLKTKAEIKANLSFHEEKKKITTTSSRSLLNISAP